MCNKLIYYRYVGLCASVKIIALAIFMIDWWLVRRRKQLDKMKPLNAADPIIGSIISLDKRRIFINDFSVRLYSNFLFFLHSFRRKVIWSRESFQL